jgi:hypothetical protein
MKHTTHDQRQAGPIKIAVIAFILRIELTRNACHHKRDRIRNGLETACNNHHFDFFDPNNAHITDRKFFAFDCALLLLKSIFILF